MNYSYIFICFLSLFLFLNLSKSNNEDIDKKEESDNISRYSLTRTNETEAEEQTENVKLINSIYFDTIQGFDFGTSNLGISLIGGLSPVKSIFDKGFFISHILFERKGTSYNIIYKSHYTLSQKDIFQPVYIYIEGKLLKGNNLLDLKIGKWTIFKIRITKAIKCHEYIQDTVNKDGLIKRNCNNTSQELKNTLAVQNSVYIAMYATSPNALIVRIPNKNSSKSIKIQDSKIDPDGISLIPFTTNALNFSDLKELEFEKNNPNIGNTQFIYDINSQFGKSDRSEDLIAVYKIDQDIYNYELKDLFKKKSDNTLY